MHQDATWYGGRPQPRRLCVVWGSSPVPKKGRSSPIFGPRILWPNGCMDQDATWYGGRPWPTRHCVSWGLSSLSPIKGTSRQFSANVRCGQTAGWTKMPHGIGVGLVPGHIVLDGVSALRERGTAPPPSFRPLSIVAAAAHFSYIFSCFL